MARLDHAAVKRIVLRRLLTLDTSNLLTFVDADEPEPKTLKNATLARLVSIDLRPKGRPKGVTAAGGGSDIAEVLVTVNVCVRSTGLPEEISLDTLEAALATVAEVLDDASLLENVPNSALVDTRVSLLRAETRPDPASDRQRRLRTGVVICPGLAYRESGTSITRPAVSDPVPS